MAKNRVESVKEAMEIEDFFLLDLIKQEMLLHSKKNRGAISTDLLLKIHQVMNYVPVN